MNISDAIVERMDVVTGGSRFIGKDAVTLHSASTSKSIVPEAISESVLTEDAERAMSMSTLSLLEEAKSSVPVSYCYDKRSDIIYISEESKDLVTRYLKACTSYVHPVTQSTGKVSAYQESAWGDEYVTESLARDVWDPIEVGYTNIEHKIRFISEEAVSEAIDDVISEGKDTFMGRLVYSRGYSETLNEGVDFLSEAAQMTPVKRKKIEDRVIQTIRILDKDGTNVSRYKDLFKSMSDTQFNSYIRKLVSDHNENFYLEFLPYKNEPTIQDIRKALDFLGVPVEEYVYYRHGGNTENPVRTSEPVLVGFIHMKRLQQILSKKNSYNLDVDKRSQKTGQVADSDKVARISDAENYALTVMEANYALKEFLGARADNASEKAQMYQDIVTNGYVQLSALESDIEDSQTINTVDVMFMGAGIKTDLVTDTLMLNRTIKEKKQRQQTIDKIDGR
jgi:hypothetical protein